MVKEDIKETIKIGVLAGWDSDNPTVNLGRSARLHDLGKNGVENSFGRTFADEFNIHRTKDQFPG